MCGAGPPHVDDGPAYLCIFLPRECRHSRETATSCFSVQESEPRRIGLFRSLQMCTCMLEARLVTWQSSCTSHMHRSRWGWHDRQRHQPHATKGIPASTNVASQPPLEKEGSSNGMGMGNEAGCSHRSLANRFCVSRQIVDSSGICEVATATIPTRLDGGDRIPRTFRTESVGKPTARGPWPSQLNTLKRGPTLSLRSIRIKYRAYLEACTFPCAFHASVSASRLSHE